MTVLFKRHFQIAYVVDNIDAGIAEFTSKYAVAKWHVMDLVAFNGPESAVRHIALAWTDAELMVELIEPNPAVASIYSNWRPDLAGPRFHHLGFLVDSDAEFAAIRRQFEVAGCPVAAEGSAGDMLDFAYIDTSRTLGHYYELIHLKGEGRTQFFRPVPHN